MKNLIFTMLLLLSSIIVHYFIRHDKYINLEVEKCPFCYGENLCPNFDKNEITFNYLTLRERLLNIINIKNVYSAHFHNRKVIIKKLGHDWEIDNIDKIICSNYNLSANCIQFLKKVSTDFSQKIVELLSAESITQNLKLCTRSVVDQFCNSIFSLNSHLNISVMTANIWTTLLASVEPLILQILTEEDGWPVPRYYGSCGRAIVQDYCGQSLNEISSKPWISRAQVALQLLKAADNFTNKHALFRFYLTDISPDNIVIDKDQRIKFIDLENIIVMNKNAKFDDTRPHHTENLPCDNCYAFSSNDICTHSISDHNFYSVCKLLLSRNAPWPMMTNGLLHSPPDGIPKDLFELVETCADSSPSMNRFESAIKLSKLLETITENKKILI